MITATPLTVRLARDTDNLRRLTPNKAGLDRSVYDVALVATRDDVIAGFVGLVLLSPMRKGSPRTGLVRLEVWSDGTRHSIERHLLTALIEIVTKREDVERLRLGVDDAGKAASEMYQSLGFEVHGVYGLDSPTIVLERELLPTQRDALIRRLKFGDAPERRHGRTRKTLQAA
ncbi:MAG: N-acetyltransferase family protein [Chloroflexota bacterium]